MAQHTETPEDVIKEMEDTYGAVMAAAMIQKTLDWTVPDEHKQDVKRWNALKEYTQRAEAEVEFWKTKPLETPTKESIAAYYAKEQKRVDACPYSSKKIGKATSRQHWSTYRFKKAKRSWARMEAAVLRKALADHETMMKKKYGSCENPQTYHPFPAPLQLDLERAEGERHGFPELY